jgi:hypothetical protein
MVEGRSKQAFKTWLSRHVPTALTEVITLGRTLTKRADDVLAYFDRPGTSNGPTEAIKRHFTEDGVVGVVGVVGIRRFPARTGRCSWSDCGTRARSRVGVRAVR